MVTGCPDSCSATIVAPAFAVSSCSSRLVNVSYDRIVRNKESSSFAPPLEQELFFIAAALVVDDGPMESIDLVVGRSSTEDCTGTLNYTACTLVSAVGAYDVTIEGGDVVLGSSVGDPEIIARSSNAQVSQDLIKFYTAFPSTLAGVVDVFQARWSCMFAT